jgi:hypothetical protein
MAATSAAPASSVGAYRTAELDYRPSYLAAGIATLVVLVLYLVTLAPSTAMWDASEYIAAAYVFGLPHPPGNPLFVLLGRVFAILPIGPNVAVRVNILAAVCSAISAGMWFLITERVLVSWFAERWQRIVGGAVAVAIGATAFTVWNQSVVNEKVYTVSLVGIAVISWLMIRWSDEPDGRKADRILVLVAFLLGLGFSNHMGGMLAGPAAALAVMIRRPRTLLRWRLLLACVGALVLGLTPFATQPIRSAHQPAINEGEPTACRDGLGFRCTFSRETYDAFMYNFNRGQYGKPELGERQAPFFSGQIGMWWYYFKWQWLRDAHGEQQFPQRALAALFFILGLIGGYVHWRRDRRSFWYFGSLMLTITLLLIYYLNFKYGNTQAPELGDLVDREVRDRDYFYLWSFSAWGVWAGLGLVFLWENIAALIGADRVRLGQEVVESPRRRSWLLAAPVLAIALIPLFTNWSTASRRGHTYTRDFAHDLLNSVEPYGILVTVGDNDTFPLWYAQEVEGIRRDVIVANTSLLNTDWYTRQLIQRPVYEYDEARGPAIYRGRNWVKPVGPALAMTPSEADSVPPYTVLSRPMVLRAGDIEATIDPRYLMQAGGGAGLLQRADVFVLRMLRDSWGQRSLYFSRTSGSYSRQLGLEQYTLSHGLAMKVFVPPAQPSGDTVFVQSEGWFDVASSQRLWNEVFAGPGALLKRGDWIDRPSVGIPYLYVATGIGLAEALRDQGKTEEARKVFGTARDVAGAVRLDQLFAALSRQQQQQILQPGPLGDTGGVTP